MTTINPGWQGNIPNLVNPAQTARASAALPAAGAFDASPTEMPCSGFNSVMLFITYTRGAAGGDMQFKVEGSPVSSGDSWFQQGLYAAGTVASGADVVSNVQREEVEYGSTGATAEKVMFGPIDIRGCERLRIPAQESGVAGTPGTAAIEAVFR